MRVLKKFIILCIIFTIGSIGASQPASSQETLSGSLNDFVNTLEDSTVGAPARHALTFRNENLIPQQGKIHFDFQAGFDLSQIERIQMGIIGYPGVDISSFNVDDQVVTMNLNPEFPPVPANTNLWILLDRVINDTTSGAHTVVGWTTTQNDSLIDGPTLTRLFNLNPDILYRVGISPEVDTTVSAGRYLTFEANGYDRYGNIIGGLLYNWFVNPDSCGFIDNGIFVGNKVGQCRVIVSYAGKADTSGVVNVVPGEIGTLHFIAVPEEGVAGWPLEDNVVLEILDIRENRKTNFEGNVHFTSTADSVDFLYDVDNPYYFTPGDQGLHIFSGGDFTIFNSDEHKIIARHRGWSGESSNIFIEPDTLYMFDIEDVQDTVQAGQPFPVRVIDAQDRYGNPANGVVRVVGGPGIVPSPNGIRPELNDIWITGGEGQANQRLFAQGEVALELVSQFYNDTTNFFSVMPGDFHTMDLEISTPQISGVPFTGESIIRAKDMFWNTKIDMDASEDTVIIESTDGASMLNNIFDEEDDFIGGICDLTVEQTTYLGSSRWIGFIAFSPSIQDTANSNLIRFISPELEQFDIVNSTIFIGDSAEASIRISNPTDSVILIDSLFILNEYNEEMRARSLINLPDSLFPEGPRNYNMYFDVDIDAPPGPTGYSIKVYSSYLGNPVISSMPNFPDYAVVAAHKFIDTDGESLSPDSATIGYNYSFSIEVTDTFNAPISLDPDSSFFVLQDSLSNQFRTNLSQPYYLLPGVANTIEFDSSYFSPVFTPGTYYPKLILWGDMDGYIYDDLLMIDYPVSILQPASLNYYSGSLRPDSAVTGSEVSFGIRIKNAGTAPINLDIDSCRFSFSDGDESYNVSADTSVARRVDIFMPGDTTIYFMPNEISDTFEPDVYHPDTRIFGYQNEILIDTLFSLTGDSVSIITRGFVSIDTLYAEVPNSPYVNYGQDFDMITVFRNLGMEPVEDIIVHLNSNSGSLYPDSIVAPWLDGNDSLVVSYPVQADSQSVWEQFQVEVSSAVGAVSGDQVEVRSSSGNNALLRKQEPSIVNIAGFGVPADTNEVFEISAGRQFNAEALVSKIGESDVVGEMRLELDFSNAPGFSVTDSISRDFAFGEPAQWRLIAASDTGMFEISTRIAGEIYDLNDNLSALGPDSVASFGVHVVPGSHLVSDLSIISPVGALDGVLSSGQSFVIWDTVSVIGEIDNVTATVVLPEDYTTVEPLTKPVVNGAVSWNLVAARDSLEVIKSLEVRIDGEESNSGELITSSDWIDLYTVKAAELIPDYYVAGPPSATDFTLDPEQEFSLGFICGNLGRAGVYPGIVEVFSANPDFQFISEKSREFYIDQEVQFTLKAPSYEIPDLVDVWIKVIDTPDDSNSNSPAPIRNDSLSLKFFVKNLVPELILDGYSGFSGQAVSGSEEKVLELAFSNKDNNSSYSIDICKLKMASYNQDAVPVAFTELASSVYLKNNAGTSIEGRIYTDSAIVESSNELVVPPGGQDTLSVFVRLNDNLNIPGFSLRVASGDISAYAIRDGSPHNRIEVLNPSGEEFDLMTDAAGITGMSLAESYGSYPNPFDPRFEACRFSYYLKQRSDISLKIYTLTGEPVWSVEFSGNSEYCREGNHSGSSTLPPIIWNGRNGSGYMVHNGVYIAVFKAFATGEQVRTKVAILK